MGGGGGVWAKMSPSPGRLVRRHLVRVAESSVRSCYSLWSEHFWQNPNSKSHIGRFRYHVFHNSYSKQGQSLFAVQYFFKTTVYLLQGQHPLFYWQQPEGITLSWLFSRYSRILLELVSKFKPTKLFL